MTNINCRLCFIANCRECFLLLLVPGYPFTSYYQGVIMSTEGPQLPLNLQLFSIRVEWKSASLDQIFSPSLGKMFVKSKWSFPRLQNITAVNNDVSLYILDCKYTLSVWPQGVLINCIFWNSVCVFSLLYSRIKGTQLLHSL